MQIPTNLRCNNYVGNYNANYSGGLMTDRNKIYGQQTVLIVI